MKSPKRQNKNKWQVGICDCCRKPIYSNQKWILLEPPLKLEWSNKKYSSLVHRNNPCLDKTIEFIFDEISLKMEGYEFLCKK